MKDLGVTSKIWGIEIKRDINNNYLFQCQETYLKKVLGMFEMPEFKSITLLIS